MPPPSFLTRLIAAITLCAVAWASDTAGGIYSRLIFENLFGPAARVLRHAKVNEVFVSSCAVFLDRALTWYRTGEPPAHECGPIERLFLEKLTANRHADGRKKRNELQEVEDASGVVTRKKSEWQDGKWVRSEYDGAGQRLRVNYPGGREISLEYDVAGRPKFLRTADLPGSLASFAYAGPGREDARNYANGTAHFTRYNTLGRAEAVEFTRSGSAFAAYQYKHDALGQRRAAVETVTDSGQVYQLDSLYRLTSEGRGISAFDFNGLEDFNINNASVQDLIAADNSDQYQLDAAGNAVSMTRDGVNTAREVTSSGEYTRIGDQARTVDFEGNLLSDGRFAYEYDGLNRLVEVRDAQGAFVVARYKYDALGRRVAKIKSPGTANEEITKYIWDGWNIIEEYSGTELLLWSHVHGTAANSPVGSELSNPLVSISGGGELRFYHADGQGNIAAVTDGEGEILHRYRWTAFGEAVTLAADGNSVEGTGFIADTPFGFASQFMDAETGLVYMRHRYFSPETQQFITRDPLGILDGLNLHAYAGFNPLEFTDPLGLAKTGWDDLAKFGAELFGALADAGEGALDNAKDFLKAALAEMAEAISDAMDSLAEAAETAARDIADLAERGLEQLANAFSNPTAQFVLKFVAVLAIAATAGAIVGTLAAGAILKAIAMVAVVVITSVLTPAIANAAQNGALAMGMSKDAAIGAGILASFVAGAVIGRTFNVPNPGGRLGDARTKAVTAELVNSLKNQGYTNLRTEAQFPTSGGLFRNRYADVAGTNPKTGAREVYQIGRTTSAGNPVSRERAALIDIVNSPKFGPSDVLYYIDKVTGKKL